MTVDAGITVHHVRVPFRAPFATAAGTWAARESWLVRVTDAGGRTGWGEAVVEAEADRAVLAALLDMAATTGLEPSESLLVMAGAAGPAVRGAFETARRWLAAPPDPGVQRVGVNATIGAVDTGAAVEAAEIAVGDGFRTLKLKAGPKDTSRSLVERVSAVRAMAGDEVALRLDVNGTWDLATATERLRVLAGFGLQYVEQPLAPGALADVVALRRRVGVPIAADEAVASLAAARAVLDAGAADVLVVKPARVGGPGPVAEIAELAAGRGVPVVVSSLFETGVGLAAALACAAAVPDVPGWPPAERDHGLATAGLLAHDLLRRPLVVEHGRIRSPGGARSGGLGVAVDEAAVARYLVDGA